MSLIQSDTATQMNDHMQGFLRHIEYLNHWSRKNFTPWFIGETRVGYLKAELRQALAQWPHIFSIESDSISLQATYDHPDTRTEVLSSIISKNTVSEADAADFDTDGDVDGLDFLHWQLGAGSGPGATKTDGDADLNGLVNVFDLTQWQGEFGSVNASTDVDYVGGSFTDSFQSWGYNLVGSGSAVSAGAFSGPGDQTDVNDPFAPHVIKKVPYAQLPEEPITPEEYQERLHQIQDLDWSGFVSHDDGAGERYCTGDACEVDLLAIRARTVDQEERSSRPASL